MRRLAFLFSVWACAASAAFGAVKPMVDVPMRYVHGAVLVDVRVNGSPRTFLVDTGATACAVTPKLAQELHLPRAGWANVAAIGADRRVPAVRMRSLSVGSLEADGLPALVVPDNGLSRHVGGLAVDGVLGTTFLWKWPVEFDYPAGRFRIYPSDYDVKTLPVEAPWSGLANLSIEGHAAFLSVALNGSKPQRFMLDTGATGMVINEATAQAARAHSAPMESTSVGAFGPSRRSLYWLFRTIRLGGLTVENAQAFTPQPLGSWASRQLGNDALDQFRMTVDARRGVLRLERDRLPQRFADSPWGLGLRVRRDPGGVRVAEVLPGSEAAAAGILPEDTLLKVGADTADMIEIASLADLLNQPPGYAVTLQFEGVNGKPRTVSLTSRRYVKNRDAGTQDAIATTLSVTKTPVTKTGS